MFNLFMWRLVPKTIQRNQRCDKQGRDNFFTMEKLICCKINHIFDYPKEQIDCVMYLGGVGVAR